MANHWQSASLCQSHHTFPKAGELLRRSGARGHTGEATAEGSSGNPRPAVLQEAQASSLQSKTDMTKGPLVISFLSTRLITVSKGKPPITPKSQKPFFPGSPSGEGRILFKDALVKEVAGHMLGFLSAPCPRPPSDLNAFKQD